jgi:hypothetical protein
MENQGQPAVTAPAWVVNSVEVLMSLFKQQKANGIWAVIQWKKMISEACLIVMCFWGTAWRPMLAILVAGLGALRVRDIQVRSSWEPAAEAATDGLVMATAMIVSQLYFVATNPAFATLHSSELAHGVALSLMTVAGWRLIMDLCSKANDLGKLAEFKVFRAALRVHVLLMTAAVLIAIANENAVPGGIVRNAFLAAMTLISMGVSCRYQKKSGRLFFNGTDGTMTIMTYEPDADTDCKADSLPQPTSIATLKTSADLRKAAFFRLLFVACVMSTTGIAVWRWFFGDPSNIRWGQLLANVVGFAFLITGWHIITYFNLATAAAMRREAIKRKADKE